MVKMDQELLARIAEFFPAAIKRALDDYDEFITGSQDKNAVAEVSNRNKAKKAIIAHMQLLFKLWEMMADAGVKVNAELEETRRNAFALQRAHDRTKAYLEAQKEKSKDNVTRL